MNTALIIESEDFTGDIVLPDGPGALVFICAQRFFDWLGCRFSRTLKQAIRTTRNAIVPRRGPRRTDPAKRRERVETVDLILAASGPFLLPL